jgi:hypothetical protein
LKAKVLRLVGKLFATWIPTEAKSILKRLIKVVFG